MPGGTPAPGVARNEKGQTYLGPDAGSGRKVRAKGLRRGRDSPEGRLLGAPSSHGLHVPLSPVASVF